MYHHSEMFLVLCAVCSLLQAFSDAGQTQRTFVTAFLTNYIKSPNATFQLYLVTCDKAATVTVTVSQPFFNKTVHVDKDSSSLVTLDYTYMMDETDVTSKVILVTSDVAISVFAFSTRERTADAISCLPQEDLGKEYYIITPEGTGVSRQFAVVNGFEDEVQVHITVSGSITYKGKPYKTGDSFTLLLGKQQVIQFQSSDDLTGTKISSSAPVAILAGHTCFVGYGSTCDTLMEQLHPVENWGEVFAVFPFFIHTKDVIRLIAGSPDTLVTINSPKGATQHSLQEGGHVRITVDNILLINANKPVMVSYLLQESSSAGIQYSYDPFITTVPPSLLGRRYYKFVTQSLYDNFILIVSQASSDSKFYLDGKPLSSYPTTMKEFNGFRGWQVSLGKTEGQHEIYHETSTFTLYVFGTEASTSYGYSVGKSAPCPEPTQEPECSIRCLPDVAEYILPHSLVSDADLDALNIHLKDPLCQAKKEKDHYLIRIPYTRCGSNVLYEDGKTFYANTIYGTIPDTDIHRIEIPVRCEIESNKTLELIINPKVNDVICKSYYNISMKLYQSDSFTEPITLYPHEVDLHSNLHVELEVESDEKLQIFVESFIASPSLEDTKKKYKVISQGCQVDSTLRVHPVTDRRLQRFSFHAFKFENFHDVYLSCNVIICHNSTSPNRCTQGCISSRQRRDVRTSKEQVDSARLSQGPLVFVSEEKPAHGGSPTLASVLSVVLCVTVISAVLGLVVQKEYYRRQQRVLLQSSSNSS
ncbi:IgGFc-binding protein-like isoform X2 [Eleutherodactylus coqui]|uniref:IgGFc-binding protein-like isoform X2 n=1 Tax=Eleutherodactylus coqui TaxID=57060 RepID=UPI003461942A